MASHLHEILARHLDGETSESESIPLWEGLLADPQALEQYLELRELNHDLRRLLTPGAHDDAFLHGVVNSRANQQKDRDGFVEAVAERYAAQRTTSRRSRTRRKSIVGRTLLPARMGAGAYLALAAAVLLVVGLVFVLTRRSSSDRNVAQRSRETAELRAPPGVSHAPPAVPAARPAGHPVGAQAVEPAAPTAPTADESLPGVRQETIPAPPPLRPPPGALGPSKVARAPEPAPAGAATGRLARPSSDAVTEHPLARLGRSKGTVWYARGAQGRWAKAAAGIRLMAGDRLDTRTGMARLDLDGASAVYAGKGTLLRLRRAITGRGEARLVTLDRGEVFVVDESTFGGGGDGAAAVIVETADGLFVPVGTRFDVKRGVSQTVVAVAEGTVEARAKPRKDGAAERKARDAEPATAVDLRGRLRAGRMVRVRAGYQARVRKGAAPPAPRKANLTRTFAWVNLLGDPYVLFRADLSAGLPAGMRFAPEGEALGSRPPLPQQPVLVQREGGTALGWETSSRRWSWGRLYLVQAISVRDSVVVSTDLPFSKLSPVHSFNLIVRPAGSTDAAAMIRFVSRGGKDYLVSGMVSVRSPQVKLFWSETVADRAVASRKVDLLVGPQEVVLAVDGVEKFRGPHGLRLSAAEFIWAHGFSKVSAPVYVRLGTVAVRRQMRSD